MNVDYGAMADPELLEACRDVNEQLHKAVYKVRNPDLKYVDKDIDFEPSAPDDPQSLVADLDLVSC